MIPIAANPLLGVLLHGVGAFFAATCYTPQKRVKRWSWQTYWLTQAAFCWFLLPIVGAMLTIPDLGSRAARGARATPCCNSFLLGAAYGIGGTAFGISIRYIGFSLTYAIAVGLSSVLGTLIPPLVKGTLGATLSKPGAGWIVAGIVVGTVGHRGRGLGGATQGTRPDCPARTKGEFSLMKGLLLSLLAGVLSAVYGFALEAGEPIADVATAHGAGVWRGNVVYIFSNTGAFLTTAIYCLWLHARHRTLGELVELPAGPEKAQPAGQLGHGDGHRAVLVRPVLLLQPRPRADGPLQVHELGDPHDHARAVQQRRRRRAARVARLPAPDPQDHPPRSGGVGRRGVAADLWKLSRRPRYKIRSNP